MPIFDYRCLKCGHKFEHYHKLQNEAKPPCENCGHDKVIKLPSFPGMIDVDGKITTASKSKNWRVQKDKNKEHNQKMGVDIK